MLRAQDLKKGQANLYQKLLIYLFLAFTQNLIFLFKFFSVLITDLVCIKYPFKNQFSV